MLPTTRKLRKQILRLPKHQDRLKTLKGTGAGLRCFLLGCGQSLNALSPKPLGGELVIAVKHAYIPFGMVTDYHLVSRYKYVRYAYDRQPIVMGFTQPSITFRGQADVLMPLHFGGEFKKSVTATEEFDRWRMDRTFDRCCGPGMVYELGFYLAVHLGVREIITAGVDFDGREHFYAAQPAIRGLIRRKGKLRGKEKELEYMIRGVPLWNTWLAKQGITWKFLDAGQETVLREHLPSFRF